MSLCVKRWIVPVFAFFALFLCSCGNPAEISETDSRMLEELGQAFIDDLNQLILRNKETPELLAEFGYVVFVDKTTLGSDALARFYVEYGEKADTEVTIIFKTDSFVAARVVFRGGQGFYLRYEYDRANTGTLNVSGKLIDEVELDYYDSPPKWDVILYHNKKETANFELDNPQNLENPED